MDPNGGRKKLHYLWIPAALVLAALLFCAVSAFLCVRAIVKCERRSEERVRGRDEPAFPEAFRRWDTEWDRVPFRLDVGDAVLDGEYVRHPEGSGRVVIFCHGHTVCRLGEVKYAPLFYDQGWSLLFYDHRYFGRSTGDRCTLGQKESEDLRKVMAYAREVFGQDAVIALQGESMGAATALYVLDREKPAFVAADCPFCDTLYLFRYMLPHRAHLPRWPLLPLAAFLGRAVYGYDMAAVSPIRSVEQSDTPICLFHGEADKLIPNCHSERLLRASRNPKSRMHSVPGAHHAAALAADPEGYARVLQEFMQACMKEETHEAD